MSNKEFVVYNDKLISKADFSIDLTNRAFRFGDSIFETIRVFDGTIPFIDEHFNRLTYSLNLVKMKLPQFFTKEYLQQKVEELSLATTSFNNANSRVRLTVFRKPENNIYFVDNDSFADFIIEFTEIDSSKYNSKNSKEYSISLFGDIPKSKDVLSQIKTNNVLLHTIAGMRAKELIVDNILLINEENNITEAVNANVFVVKSNIVSTPKLNDGCVNGIIRRVLSSTLKKYTEYKFEERSISKEELLSCDEVFLTNSIMGIQPVNTYKGKVYSTDITSEIIAILNNELSLRLDLKGN